MNEQSRMRMAPDYRVSPAPTFQEVIAADINKPGAILKEYSEVQIDMGRIPRERYTSKAFFDQEVERMWSRTWIVACREEQIPEVGDSLPFDMPGASLIMVRSDDNEIKALFNTCLHRGMKLCQSETSVAKFRCPYHGFTWNIDGTLAHIPARWDFDRVSDDEMRLPEARVGRWGGFVWVNLDPSAPSLEEYLGPLVRHFADWSYDRFYLATNVRKVIHANWKACIEAFVEAYHVPDTHSEALPFGGESSTQYDIWPDNDHVSRFLEPTGIPSDQFPREQTQQQILEAMWGPVTGDTNTPTLPEGMTARFFMAQMIRDQLGKDHGEDYSHISDSEAFDPAQYSVFPNLVIFRGGLPYHFTYRFVPVRGDPDKTIFDFMIFKPKPKNGSIPAVNHVNLGYADRYADCGAFAPWHGLIYDQDSENLEALQEGLKAGVTQDLRLSRYQEVRVRFLHSTLSKYLAMPKPEVAR